jgi:transposase
MTALLNAYCPQGVEWVDDIRTTLVCAVLLRWPTGASIKQVRPSTREQFLHAHHSMRNETISTRMAAIQKAVPLTTDQAVMTSAVLLINALATQMQTTIDAIREFDQELEKLCRTHEDYHLLAALPGAGPVDAARLTAAMGPARDRWTTVDKRLCFSGVAPVLERSGKSTWSRWHSCCPKFLRPSCHE